MVRYFFVYFIEKKRILIFLRLQCWRLGVSWLSVNDPRETNNHKSPSNSQNYTSREEYENVFWTGRRLNTWPQQSVGRYISCLVSGGSVIRYRHNHFLLENVSFKRGNVTIQDFNPPFSSKHFPFDCWMKEWHFKIDRLSVEQVISLQFKISWQ